MIRSHSEGGLRRMEQLRLFETSREFDFSFFDGACGGPCEGSKHAPSPVRASVNEPGLSKYHILPHNISREDYRKREAYLKCKTEVEFYYEGNLVRVKQKRHKQYYPVLGMNGEIIAYTQLKKKRKKRRGTIKNFSKASRNRLMMKMAKLNREKTPYFLTLTYPSSWPSARESKKHLSSFIKRLKRRYGDDLGYIWKLEFQKRGAPHYHLFLWGINDYGKELMGWIADSWAEVCKMDDENHVKAGTSIQKIRSWKGVRSYSAKYFGKIDENEREKGIGRVWGIGGNVPFSDVVRMEIDPRQRHKILRYLRKRVRVDSKRMRNFVVENPGVWIKNFRDLVDPVPF